MKLLLDTCVWGKAKGKLIRAGHDVIWSGDWDTDPGDMKILARAHNEGRVLITLDKDFGELAIIKQRPHCGIIRLVNISAKQQASVTLRLLERFETELVHGAILTVDRKRVRVRQPEKEV